MKNNKTILFFSYDYPPLAGGVSRLCENLTAHLRLRGYEVIVISQHPDSFPFIRLSKDEIRVCSLRPLREIITFFCLLWLKLRQPYFFCVAGICYPEGFLMNLLGFERNVLLAHGSEILGESNGLKRYTVELFKKQSFKKAHRIISNSRYTEHLVKKLIKNARTETIPLGVDLKRFSPGDKEYAKRKIGLQGKKVIGTVARIHAYKGMDAVFKALSQIEPHLRQFLVYAIAGDGPDRNKLENEAKKLGVNDHIRWFGYVGEKDLPDFYRAMDLYVMLTREEVKSKNVEGFGLSFLEAQACGIPVVGSKEGGICDAVLESKSGWLLNARDSAGLVGLLTELGQNETKFADMGKSARSLAQNKYSWDQYTDKFLRGVIHCL